MPVSHRMVEPCWTAESSMQGPGPRWPPATIRDDPECSPAVGHSPGDGLPPTSAALILLAAERFPEHGAVLLSTVVGATVVFEILGPVLVRRVLR